MNTGTSWQSRSSEPESPRRERAATVRACGSILSLLFVVIGVNNVGAESIYKQMAKEEPTCTRPVYSMHLSNLPLVHPSKSEVYKDISNLVQLAREIIGKIDMTSVGGGTLEQTHDQNDSKSSLKIIDDCFLLCGQNTDHVASQDCTDGGTYNFAICCNKSEIKDSPTDNPLSFAREYTLTKK